MQDSGGEQERPVPINLDMGRLSINPQKRVGVSGHGYNPDFLAGR